MVSFNFSDSEDTVATQLKGTDVLIACCLIDGLDFANSAKKSGVKRCVPCFDPSVMPRGVRTLRDNVSGGNFPVLTLRNWHIAHIDRRRPYWTIFKACIFLIPSSTSVGGYKSTFRACPSVASIETFFSTILHWWCTLCQDRFSWCWRACRSNHRRP